MPYSDVNARRRKKYYPVSYMGGYAGVGYSQVMHDIPTTTISGGGAGLLALKNYPTNKYQEELNWIVLQAKYQQAINSVEAKKMDRARDAEDEYYNFITEYPESKHRNAAERIGKEMKRILEH